MAIANLIITHNLEAVELGHGFILLLDSQCIAHILHREIESIFSTKSLIGKLYATSFSVSLPGSFASIYTAIRDIIAEDLSGFFYPGLAPPPGLAGHAERLAHMTLLRTVSGSGLINIADAEDSVIGLIGEFCCLFNGDLRADRVQHYAIDGLSMEVCIERMSNLVSSWMSIMSKDLPASHRWYTFPKHLAVQSLCMFVHRLLPRVLERAWRPITGDDDGDDPDADDFHRSSTKKRRTALEFAGSGFQSAQLLGVALVTTSPLDRLSLHLQHLDHNRSSMRELTDTRPSGMLLSAQSQLWAIANSWTDQRLSQQMDTLTWILDGMEGAEDSFDNIRSASVGAAAAVWCRLELRCSRFPCFLDAGLAGSVGCMV